MSDDPIATDTPTTEGLAILRRCLAKLSFAGMGLDRELDKRLESLRQAVRKEQSPEELQAEVEAITTILMQMEDAAARAAKVEPDYAGLLARLAEMAQGSAAKSVRSLRREVDGLPSEQQGEATVAGLAKLLAGGGLLSRLFGNKAADQAPGPGEAQTLAAPAVLEPVARLLAQLSLPEIYQERLAQLRQRGEAGLPVTQLPELIESIVDLVLDASSDDQTRLEAFLLTLNQRLEQVYQFLATTTSTQNQDAQDCAQLDRSLRDQVQDMQDSLRDATSLDQLKHTVEARLNAILSSVGQFKSGQDERRGVLQAQVAQLENQLRVMETESNHLRQTLVEQRHRALTDVLTGVPNRTAYLERLEQEYARLRRYRSPLTLSVMDIDHFKRVNDQYGHAAGDAVLKSVARLLQGGLRKSDFLARYGGEEFVILMPETSLADATKAVNKLRLAIQNRMIEAAGQGLAVTASFGVADFREGDTTAEVFSRADKAMYRAKERGRNQVCCELPRNGTEGEV
ncbi:MAG: diguanylate cyclase [Gammaproteobacteria bacterium]|nr:diguanylate cyclase [Gammaproteobacteria bacterium]